ncbi:MAG: hypothetical protein ACRC7R_01590 [Sarcina sp.]
MKISQVIQALELMKGKYGDIDVCIEKKKEVFADVEEVINARYTDKDCKESFAVLTDIKF